LILLRLVCRSKRSISIHSALEDYQCIEYGSITGKVNSISLISNSVKTSEGDVETYLVTIRFPEELKTNYGTNCNLGLK